MQILTKKYDTTGQIEYRFAVVDWQEYTEWLLIYVLDDVKCCFPERNMTLLGS